MRRRASEWPRPSGREAARPRRRRPARGRLSAHGPRDRRSARPHPGRPPSARRSSDRTPGRHCSSKTYRPRVSPSHPTNAIESPRSRARSMASRSLGPRCSPCSSMSKGLPSDIEDFTPWSSEIPSTPRPATTRTCSTVAVAGRPAPRDVRRSPPRARATSMPPEPRHVRARDPRSSGCSVARDCTAAVPVVRVPVLSNRTALTSASRSSASPLRKRTWWLAAWPIALQTARGVASPRAHGQAMRLTASPAISPCSSEPSAQCRVNASTARLETAGKNQAEIRSTSLW